MKKLIALLTVMVLVLAYGLAFADDWPTFDRNTAAKSSEKASPKHEAKGEAAGGVREGKSSIGKAQREMIESVLFTDRSRDLPPYGVVQ